MLFGILGVFFIAQLQLYTATAETLQHLNLTLAEVTREVFGHMIVIALIVYVLLYLDRGKKVFNNVLLSVLTVETILLNAVALRSVYQYSQQWGFTFKRLFGYTGVLWILGIFTILINEYHKRRGNAQVAIQTVLVSAFILVGVNLANFDYLIFHYAQAKLPFGVDYWYMATLSSDSLSYHDQLDTLFIDDQLNVAINATGAADVLLYQIERLQRKYQNNIDVRSFNASEYQMYLHVADVDMDSYRAKANAYRHDGTDADMAH